LQREAINEPTGTEFLEVRKKRKPHKISEKEVEEIHGQRKRQKVDESSDSDDMVGPSLSMMSSSKEISEETTSTQLTSTTLYNLPITNEVTIEAHSQPVTCLAIDSVGDMMVSGSYDSFLKLWSLNSMNRQLKPMREWTPYKGFPLTSLKINAAESKFVCTTNHNQMKVFGIEGKQLKET